MKLEKKHYMLIVALIALVGAGVFLYSKNKNKIRSFISKDKKNDNTTNNTETKKSSGSGCYLCFGSKGDKVKELQYYLGFSGDKLDGKWGKDTQAQVEKMLAVKSFKTQTEYETAINVAKKFKR